MANTQQLHYGTKAKVGAPPKIKRHADTKSTATKSERITALLRRAKGASIAEIMTATGWQSHSVRGFISGTLVKQKGLKLESEKTNGERRYRVIAAEAAS